MTSVFDFAGITRAQAAQLQAATRTGGGGRWATNNHAGAPVAAVDTLYLYWFPEIDARPLTLLRTRCQTGGAGSAVKFALWRDNPATGRPRDVPVIGQNTGLSTVTSGTWQDLVVASVPMSSPTGWWFGSKYTGTLPSMICDQALLTFTAVWPVGGMPTVPRKHFTLASSYATDIMTENLTGAGLADFAGAVPAFAYEWA